MPCREFSTDGTSLGAEIAHSMGTDSEAEIIRQGWIAEDFNRQPDLTGMTEEQADWEESE
jgi:hypothetical protein